MRRFVDAIWIRARMQETDDRYARELQARARRAARVRCASCLLDRGVIVPLVANVCHQCGTEGPA